MSWFISTLIAMIMGGIQSFFFKKVAEKGCNNYLFTFFMYASQVALAFAAFLIVRPKDIDIIKTVLFAVLLAAVFFAKLLMDLKALKYLPTSVALPIISSQMVLVIIFGITVLKERLFFTQLIGIMMIFISVLAINIRTTKTDKTSDVRKGLIYAFVSVLLSAGTTIINKYAAVGTNPIAFNVIVQTFLMFAAGVIYLITRSKKEKGAAEELKFKPTIRYGILVGMIGFVFYSLYLFALSVGPVSIIQPTLSLSTIVTILLGRLILKEKLSPVQFLLVLLSVGGVIMTRIQI